MRHRDLLRIFWRPAFVLISLTVAALLFQQFNSQVFLFVLHLIIFARSYSELHRRGDVGPVFFSSAPSGLPRLFLWRWALSLCNVVPLAKSLWVLYPRLRDPSLCHWRWVNNFGMHCTVSIWSNLCSKVGHCIVLASIYLTKEVNKVPSLCGQSDCPPFQYLKYLGLNKDIFWNVYFGKDGNNMIFD